VEPELIEKLIIRKQIRALHNGEEFLIYQDQFTTHLEQMKKYQLMLEEYQREPIPEDWDAKDED